MRKWYEEAVFYHMYPIGMTGAPRHNDAAGIVHRLPALEEWLGHIRDIGCDAIYIGPLFESSTHGYDTVDYRLTDRRLGDNSDFRRFVKKAHEQGIKVVVDGVFNHTGRGFFAFKDIQKNREQSRYCKWYQGISFDGDTPYQDGFSYQAWRGCFELVNLNLKEPEVTEYLLASIQFWIREFDIDGIRLDCADCLDFGFMEALRRSTDEWKTDFWLMGEVIHGDYARYIGDGSRMLHSVTNYELHKALYSSHNDHNYFEIAHTARREFEENGGIYRDLNLYSFADNHDVDRLASKINKDEHIQLAYLLMYMLPGIPSLYYGSEWGLEGQKCGASDDALRPAVSLAEMRANNPHPKLTKWLRMLAKLRRQYPVCSFGKYRELYLTNRQYAFGRIDADEAVVIAVNNDDQPVRFDIPLPLPGKRYCNAVTGEVISGAGDKLEIALGANEGVVIAAEKGA